MNSKERKEKRRKRLAIANRMQQVHERCYKCPNQNKTTDPDLRCGGCLVYQELRELSKELGIKDTKAKWREDMEGYY